MKDVYYLIDSDGYVTSKLEIDKATYAHFDGRVYLAKSWNMDPSNYNDVEYEFLAEVYCKFDSCTHWWFNGEDYDVELKTEKDSYYHLCGSGSFTNHIRGMCFVWRLAPEIMKACGDDWSGEYNDCKVTNELVDLMLRDYTIKHITEDAENEKL